MAEFLCRGYKCDCGKVVKVAQLDKSKPLPTIPKGQQYLGGLVSCPYCRKETWIKPEMLTEWTEEHTVQ
jgi:hypothetical protein